MTVITEEESPTTEADYNTLFCAEVGGEQEVRLDYSYGLGESYVVADCVTDTHVWEGGLDKRSSLDSMQQALFFSALTGKQPSIVIYDMDGMEGQYEYQIRTAAELAGIEYLSYDWREGLNEEEPEAEIEVPVFDMPDFDSGFDFGW